MDESFTAATSRALEDRLRTFVRRRALAEHFAAFPAMRGERTYVGDVGRAAVSEALTDRGAAAKFLDRVAARGYATEGPGPEAAVKAVRAVRDSWERPHG